MEKHARVGNLVWALSLLVRPPAICLWLVAWSFVLVWNQDPALQAHPAFAYMWRNALPISLLGLLAYATAGRRILTFAFITGFTLLLYRVDAIKELNMNSPLLPGDLALGHQVFDNIGFFANYIHHGLLWLIAALLFAGGALWAWHFERRWGFPGWKARVAGAVLTLGALCTLYRGDLFWQKAYSTGQMVGFPLWHPVGGVHKVGLIAGFIRMAHEADLTIPEPDRPLVRNFAQAHARELRLRSQRPAPVDLPDIVVVQSEAFFDPGVLKGVSYGQYTPNFERLARLGISGGLKTPAYGGGTIRTEFETLTGYPVQAFPSITFPYYGLAADWMPSVPRRLGKLGYSAQLFHPFKASFWNRAQVMPRLGFQQTFYEGKFKQAEHVGLYVSDHSLFEFVLDHMDQGTARPQYTMVITMENHGPWASDVGSLADVLHDKPLPEGVSDEAKRELVHYLSHVVNGDRALASFAERLLARRRWTVLLFYGDHLPALPHAFAEIGFDDSKPGTSQRTRYMLLSNKPLSPRTLDLNSYDLPGLLFDTLGFPETGSLALSAEARHAWALGNFEHEADFGHIKFDAARMEVKCNQVLALSAECSSAHMADFESSATAPGAARQGVN